MGYLIWVLWVGFCSAAVKHEHKRKERKGNRFTERNLAMTKD